MLKITFGRNKRAADVARMFEIYKALVVKRVWINGNSSDMEFYELSRRAVESFNRFVAEDETRRAKCTTR